VLAKTFGGAVAMITDSAMEPTIEALRSHVVGLEYEYNMMIKTTGTDQRQLVAAE
jgi:hypothetical protein